jgi:hypothetical protein
MASRLSGFALDRTLSFCHVWTEQNRLGDVRSFFEVAQKNEALPRVGSGSVSDSPTIHPETNSQEARVSIFSMI